MSFTRGDDSGTTKVSVSLYSGGVFVGNLLTRMEQLGGGDGPAIVLGMDFFDASLSHTAPRVGQRNMA